jgi:uncharacterized protein DUF6129
MIEQDTLSQIAARIETAGVDESTVNLLRQEFSDLHFTYCSEDDIPNNEAIVEKTNFNLYLVDGREHCLCLTRDFDVATGVVIAEIYQE